MKNFNLIRMLQEGSSIMKKARGLLLLCALLLMNAHAWGADFTATEIVYNSGAGTTTNHVKCSSGITTTTSKKVKNVSADCVAISQNTDTATYTGNDWIQIQADADYLIDRSTIAVTGASNTTSSGSLAVVCWRGAYSATAADSCFTVTAAANNSTTEDQISISLRSNFRTIRLYKRINYKTGTIGKDANGSTYRTPSSGVSFNIKSITATAVASASDHWYIYGNFSDGETWTDTEVAMNGNVDINIPMDAHDYAFKIKHTSGASTYYSGVGNGSYMSRDNHTNWYFNGSYNCGLRTDIGGTYNFALTLDGETPVVTVTYPTGVAVTLDYNYSSLTYTWQAKSGYAIPTPNFTPERSGFSFEGWYSDAECTTKWEFPTPINSSQTLYARWEYNWYYKDAWIDSWALKLMTRSADGAYWYYEVDKSSSNREFGIEQNSYFYNRNYVHKNYMCTDIGDMADPYNQWGGNDNCWVYYNTNQKFYILVFPPHTVANNTDNPKICASTYLPSASEKYYEVPSGRKIYFDNSDRDWDNVYFRRGHACNTAADLMTLVTGTDALYEVTLASAYYGYQAFNFADNSGWQGSNKIFQPYYDGGIKPNDEYAITEATVFQKYNLDGDFTFTPGDADGDPSNGCQYYAVAKTYGMKKDNVSITAPTNGSISVTYTSGSGGTLTSGNADLAHTSILTISATGATGYDLDELTVNEVAHTSGNTYVLSEDAVVAATFTLHNYNVTYSAPSNGNYTISVAGGSATSASKTATYGQTVTLAATPNTGYSFTSWTVTKAGGGTVTVTDNQFSMPADNVTITATFTAIPVSSISLSPTSATLVVGGSTQTITPTVSPSNALDKAITWSSSAEGVATVNSSGVVTAVAPGTATITATAHDGSGVTQTCSITVKCSVTYAKNNNSATGSQSDGSSPYAKDARVTVKDQGTMALEDYQFVGWNTASNAGGTWYSPGANFAITANTTLHAQWRSTSGTTCPGSAGGTVFSLSMGSSVTSSDLSIGKGATKNLPSYATISNGSAQFTNVSTSSDGQAVITDESTNQLKFASNDAMLTLYLDCALEEGDEISFTATQNVELAISLLSSRGSKDANIKATTSSKSYTIPAESPLIGAKILYLWRATGSTQYVTALTITRPADCTTPDAPDGLTVSAKTTTSATLSISDDADVNNYEIYYSTSSTAPESSTEASATTTDKSKTISGLSVGTTYYAWVRSVCNEDYKSSWVAITGSTFTTLHQYTMSYNAGTGDGISGSQSSQTKTEGTSFTLPGVVFTRSGYVQIGWATSDQGPKAYELGGSYTTDAAQTFYPVWGVVYTVTFNSNGGGAVASKTQTTYGGSITMPSGPSSTDSTFLYWVIGGNTYAASASYTPTSNITAYAAWKEKCSGGGGGSTATFNFNSGNASGLTISANNANASYSIVNETTNNIPVLDGYFLASSFTSNSSGVITITTDASYANIDSIKFNSASTDNGNPKIEICGVKTNGTDSITLLSSIVMSSGTTKKWRANPYGVDIHSRSPKYSGKVRFKLTTGSSGKHAGLDNIVIYYGGSGSGTCYYVTYDGNGAEAGCISDATAYTSSSNSVTVLGNTGGNAFVRDGYTFNGWNTKANGSGDSKTAGGTFTITKDTVLYAQWVSAASTYTVSITADPDGYGSVSSSSVTSVASGTTLSASTNTLSVGTTDVTATATSASAEYTYAFSSWTKSDGTDLPSTVTSDLSVYANFTRSAKSYTLAWNTNGGSDLAGDPTSGTVAYGTTLTFPTDPTLSNYTFDGWKTNNDGTGTTAGATMPAAATTYYAAWKQTVTLKTGAQGSGSDQTPYVYKNGTAVSSFTPHTASGYTLQGYYTAGSGGVKVLNADGTFAAANVTDYITSSKWARTDAAPTLYAQWLASEDCSTSDFVIKKGNSEQYQGCMESTSYDGTATSFTAGSATTVGNAKMTISSYSKGAITRPGSGNTFSIVIEPVSGYYLKSICWAGKVENDETVSYYWDDNSGSATTISPTTTSGTGVTYDAPNSTTTKFTASYVDDGDESGGIWWRNVQVEVCAAGGTTYNVTYDGNDETSGDEPTDATDYSYGGTVTVLGNTGDLAKTNYTFAGWTTNDDGTGSSYEAGSTFSITDNTTLYAKWTQAVTFDANTANHGSTGGSATAVWNATGLTGITHATPASGYKLAGYYTDATSGTKVLNSDGSFADTDVTDYISDSKWTRTGAAPTLYAQYEASGSIKWNLQVNSADAPIVTSSKNSSYTQISTSNMTNLDSVGLNIEASKKSDLTSKISTPASYDADKYMKVTFQVASGYKFTPSLIQVPIQPVGDGEHKAVELRLTDESSHSLVSASATKCDGTSKGKKTTVTLAGNGTYFTGTVTLKIYVYPHGDATASSNNCYRLGTPIQIDGEIESTCTMPSYTSVDYEQTEYIKDASASSISVEGGENVTSYQWKYNSTGDRTSGTNGATTASMTPSTGSTGTLYYWCELTNACGTVKTPAVAITVSASKSTATVAWTDPSTPNYGGGGYTIKATVNETGWDGNASDLTITAPAGIRIYDKTSGTDGSGKKYVQVKFDVQTAFDRETYSSNIPFTVSADATTSYNAISADHNVSYSACSGGGGSATEELMAVDASHIDNSTWKGGWVYDGIGMMRYGHGSSDISAGTKDANLKDLSYTMASGDITKYYKSSANHFGFYTEKAITGLRLYVYTSNDNVTVSNVYVANSAFNTGTPSSGAVSFEAEYNDENDALRSGTHSGSAWVDITFASEVAAGKYGQINLSNNINIAGIAFISASGSGASLTTTLAFATTGTIAKTQSAANFTNAASVTAYSETLGAITYSSSNTDCATVDSKTGEVTITASGASDLSTTITATLAASGCYKGATTTYTITVAGVSCTVNHGTLASDVTTKCSTADATLTLTGFESGATVQWYKGESTISDGDTYDITTEGTTSTMVTKEVGTYSVMVTKDECSDRSNSITISNYSAEVAATKIVDKWYIKHGRVTPDIALWALDEGTHLSSVAWSPSNETGLTAADDFYESDGIVYLKGKEPSSNESSDVEYTLTLTVKDECENTTALSTSDKQITLTHQKNTDKHVLAFVVTGTEKGAWTAGISAAQTTGVELYNEIAKNFDVQATNIYSTDDEQKLKEYYSQFDILCITDYPNTQTTGTNKKSYVDAIGSLIDIRPILTMEAWVSGLTNWKSKGISGTPKSPTTRQYSMLLQCKDHEIFSGTNPTTVGSGDETMYRIDMVDKTLEDYATLDATYGAGAHEKDKNYQYGKKPALQGFTYDASMSSLLPIGRIDDGEGNDLEVGVERQAVMEARLLVLGINGYAMERLDDDGLTIVINALKYLMKKNAEDISDCSNYFVGGAEGDPYSWKNLDNWSGSSLPDRTQEVRIVAPCVISDTIARASSVKIVTGGTYSHGTKTANGSLTINPTGSLIVEGKIYAATAPNFFEQRTTEPEDLVVKADDSYTGTLIFDNEDGETQATIEMYSPSHWEVVAGKYVKYWSYVGMPIKDVHIPDYFYGAFTYYFNEAKGWEKRFDNDIMQPFEGIGLSMQEGHKETFYGTMVSTENTDITITNHTGYGDGDNLIGNSWTAPIQIANFDAEDFGSCWATVYIFNTGKGGNTYVNANADNDGAAKAGQWLGIPIGVAGLPEYSGLKVIPAMNAFLVHDTLSTSTTLHLDYDKLVREDATTNTQINEKMRAPSRHPRKRKDVDGLMRIRVVGEKTNTDVWMLQDARFSEGFDNGWEARYNPCDDRSAQLYARSKVGVMSFIALPDLDGTVLGFAPSRDGNDYTFTFQYRGEDEYYLNDLKLQQSVLIDADNNYAFTYEKGDTNRFYVSRTPLAPQTPTGVDNASGATQSTKAIKVIYNGKLYIIRSGRVYSAEGMLVK